MKKNNKKILLGLTGTLVLILCVAFLVQGNWQKQIAKSFDKGAEINKKQKVALITKSTNSAFWKSVYSGASNASTTYNLELVIRGPMNEEDYETQNKMIEREVENGADAIVFSAIDFNANADAINWAAKKGIKIVVIDSDVNSDRVSCRIGTNNYEAGCQAGRAAIDGSEKELNIGIVNFDKNTQNGQERERGLRDVVSKNERVTIVDTINVKSTPDAAKEGTIKMMKRSPEINVVVTFNELTSLGVGYAIQEEKLADRTKVVAFDNNVVSVGMLESGEVDALIVQNPFAMGYMGIEAAYNLLNGIALESDKIDTDTMLITRENMYNDDAQRILFSFEEKK